MSLTGGTGDKGETVLTLNATTCRNSNRADVRMVPGAGRSRLVEEAFAGFGIASYIRGRTLQGDGALQFGVLGFVDDAHATRAQLLQDSIG